jgi:hypothetical protein
MRVSSSMRTSGRQRSSSDVFDAMAAQKIWYAAYDAVTS